MVLGCVIAYYYDRVVFVRFGAWSSTCVKVSVVNVRVLTNGRTACKSDLFKRGRARVDTQLHRRLGNANVCACCKCHNIICV